MAEATGGINADLYQTIVTVVDERLKEVRITRENFNELKGIVSELAQAQVRTEQRLEGLEAAVEELAQAQVRTEQRLNELVQVQTRFERTFETRMGALGARWGLDTEESFRLGMRAILEDVGFRVERYVAYDEKGNVFDHPAPVELDVIVRNGKLMLIEIKSSTGSANVSIFRRKVNFYEEREGQKADRRIIISPFVEDEARMLALATGIEIYTRADDLVK